MDFDTLNAQQRANPLLSGQDLEDAAQRDRYVQAYQSVRDNPLSAPGSVLLAAALESVKALGLDPLLARGADFVQPGAGAAFQRNPNEPTSPASFRNVTGTASGAGDALIDYLFPTAHASDRPTGPTGPAAPPAPTGRVILPGEEGGGEFTFHGGGPQQPTMEIGGDPRFDTPSPTPRGGGPTQPPVVDDVLPRGLGYNVGRVDPSYQEPAAPAPQVQVSQQDMATAEANQARVNAGQAPVMPNQPVKPPKPAGPVDPAGQQHQSLLGSNLTQEEREIARSNRFNMSDLFGGSYGGSTGGGGSTTYEWY